MIHDPVTLAPGARDRILCDGRYVYVEAASGDVELLLVTQDGQQDKDIYAEHATVRLDGDDVLQRIELRNPNAATITVVLRTGWTRYWPPIDASVGVSVQVEPGADPLVVEGTGAGGAVLVTGALTDAQLRAAPVPVSGALTDSELRATPVPVSGALTDAQLRATAVPISGALTDTQLRATAVPISGALTDTELRATPVPVSGALTDAQLRATPVPVSGTLTTTLAPASAGGLSVHHLVAGNSTNPTVIKAGAGQVYGWQIYNEAGGQRKVCFHDTASAPTAGTTPVKFAVMVASGHAHGSLPAGIEFTSGIAITTVATDSSDSGSVAVGVGTVMADIFYK